MKITIMPRLYLISILFFILIGCFSSDTKANHLAGGDMEYTCIGFRKWKVKLTLYRLCDGIEMPMYNYMEARASPTLNSGGYNLNNCSGDDIIFTCSLEFTGKVANVGKRNGERCGELAKKHLYKLRCSTSRFI
jgi:hypothetical protein